MSGLSAVFDLPLGVPAPTAARHAIVAVLRGWGLDDQDWLDGVAVVVSEVVTNAVLHGGGCVALRIEAHARRVRLSAADGSSVVPRARAADETGGRGLALIEALSVDWGVEDHEGGKRVWIDLLPPPGDGPAPETGSARGTEA